MGVSAWQLGTGSPSAARRPVIPSTVLGMLIFVAAEIMFFSGLVSAFVIGKSAAVGWPPLGQPRAPVASTAFNTAVLLASGAALFLGERALRAGARRRAARWVSLAAALGAAFVLLQGYEWVRLVWFGLTMTSSNYGAFFYLVVGAHALHAAAALLALGWARVQLGRGRIAPATLWAVEIFWYFVVGLWPILYVLVYLR